MRESCQFISLIYFIDVFKFVDLINLSDLFISLIYFNDLFISLTFLFH